MFKPGNSGSDPPVEKFERDGKPSSFVYTGPPILSSWAVISVTVAMCSPLGCCAFGFPSLLMSLVAIVTGHVSLVTIRKSSGQLVGRGIAFMGLIGGYAMFGLSMVVVFFFTTSLLEEKRNNWQDATQADHALLDPPKHIRDAEMKVLTASTDGVDTGNTQTALEMAQDYSKLMQGMSDVIFSNGEDRLLTLPESEFVTHCELHKDRCAFIVHVPAYQDFDSQTKTSLATVAWTVAQGIAEEELQPTDYLAVGLRGIENYDAVLIGHVVSEDEELGDEFKRGERGDLTKFFLLTMDDSATIEFNPPGISK